MFEKQAALMRGPKLQVITFSPLVYDDRKSMINDLIIAKAEIWSEVKI